MRCNRRHLRFSLCVAACWTLLTAPAWAAAPATIIGPDLQPQRVAIQGLGEGTISYFDQQRTYQTQRLDTLIQIRLHTTHAAGSNSPTQAGPVVDMVDGQRWFGTWRGTDEAGEHIRWRSELLGLIDVSLDNVRAITWKGDPLPPREGAGDHVLLANGDTLAGFVVAIRGDTLEMRVDGQRDALQLPLERVHAVQLANPMRIPGDSHLIWLRDGSRVRSTRLSIDEAHLVFQAGGEQRLQLGIVERIDVANSAGRLVDLADLPREVSGGRVFDIIMPVRAEADGLRLHAPVRIRITLPSGSQRLAAWAELDAPDVPERRWAHMVLSLQQNDATEGPWEISADEPRVRLNMPVEAGALTFDLNEGRNGPIMDRLLLREGFVLVRD